MIYEKLFLISLILTVVIETLVLFVLLRFLFKIRSSRISNKKIIFTGLVASGLTLPYLWFIFPRFLNATYYIYPGEILVILAEMFLIKYLLEIKYWKAILISIIANVASFILGFVLLVILLDGFY